MITWLRGFLRAVGIALLLIFVLWLVSAFLFWVTGA